LKFYIFSLFQSAHADAKPGYDSVHCYAIQITASQLSDKPCDHCSYITLCLRNGAS